MQDSYLIFFTIETFALIEIDITRGNLDPLPIAISPLHVDIKSENFDGIKIKDLVKISQKSLKTILEQQVYLIL